MMPPSTRLRRLHDKGAHDRATIDAILDAMPVAHVGHLVEGWPTVTPTLQWREGDRIYWHGSSASRMVRAARGAPVCVTVTLTDAMVLARSGFESSVNYRCVMVFGTAEPVTGTDAKRQHLKAMMDRMFPGRWETLRPMTEQELKATAILSLPLTQASAKIAAAAPGGTDPDADRSWPVWAGLLPIRTVMGDPQPAPDLPPGTALPPHATGYRFGALP
jgi:nitroimidazol reductase NimA-like FMN-containing flavoprotein (pyridoxamine 5'-phosphate oxidase superfamily)